MRNFTFIILMLMATITVNAQTVNTVTLLSENFDGPTHQMTTSNNLSLTGDWFIIDTLFVSSNNCIHSPIYPITGQGSYLTTPMLPYLNGATNYYLTFKNIAKLSNIDYAIIEYRFSIGGTAPNLSWSPYSTIVFSNDSTFYTGNSLNISNGRFNHNCYPNWLPSNNSALPANNWWQTETLDITSFVVNPASNGAYFQLRFKTMSIINNLIPTGWFIDDVEVYATGNGLGIDQTAETSYSVYPNPVENQLVIENGDQITQIELFQMDGKQIKSIINNCNTIDVSDLSSGIYMIKLIDKNNHSTIKKIVKL